MDKYECPCTYIYDPLQGDPKGQIRDGTVFHDLPDTWQCPVCGAGKDFFWKLISKFADNNTYKIEGL
ncbi:MAG: rubredoxin [Desulfobacterales bacterium]|nr:rubredoxin [Desulfobacterales bacterium]